MAGARGTGVSCPPDAPNDAAAVVTDAAGAATDAAAPATDAAGAANDAAVAATDAAVAATDAPVMPACADSAAGRKQVLYMTGSSYFPPLLAQLAPIVIGRGGYTPVYKVSNSCTGVRSIFGEKPSDHVMTDPAPGSGAPTAMYFKADGTPVPCSLGPGGAEVDVGESDIFSTTCTGFGPPGGSIGEYIGPVQSMVFVVPGNSKQMAISAAAAREVFGMGGNNGTASPWTDPSLYFVRTANAGTQQIIAHAINVPASAFWGKDRGSPTNIDGFLRVIEDPVTANKAIGILASDTYDKDRANLRALAFKATGQECAYLPDSTEFKLDKQNVRDGHYPIWGPLHFFTGISAGALVSAAAQAFISNIIVPNPVQELVDAFIASSLIPDCAMKVKRTAELGPLTAYEPPFQCTCHFEKVASGMASSGCTPCMTSDDCNDPSRPSCNLGFCEVR